MDDMYKREDNTPLGGYVPEDEYEPIDTASVQTAQITEPAQTASQPAAQAVPPQPAPYPAAQPYPMYPPYAMPYPGAMQQPPQAPPTAPQQPYYPGYAPYTQPCYPQQTAYQASAQYPPYPQQAAPSAAFQPQQPIAPYIPPVTAAPPAEPSGKGGKKPKNPSTSTGTKVFLIVLSALLVAMIAGFGIYIANIPSNTAKNSSGSNLIDNLKEYYEDIYKEFGNNNKEKSDDPNGNGGSFGQQDSYDTEEFDVEITLVEDKGETQKRSDDNSDSAGAPDPNAKGITLEALPKDKDDAKYTTQSAYESVGNSVVTVELYKDKITDKESDIVGLGTGTIISSDGYIVTNAHVIGNSRRYAVNIVMLSGDSYQAKIVGYDTWTDLAVLKIDAKGLTPVVFGDSELIEIGQDVIAIGSPGGEKFQNSLTKGIVSAVGRELSINKYVRYIQSDAAISPGNSGGPLCNIYGQAVGINTAKNVGNYEAMTFSIPSATVKEIADELIRYGYVRGRTRIGLSGTEVSEEEQYYYGTPSGVVISEIDENGSLAGTKIKEGDIITAVDGEDISTFQDIYAILNQHKPGDKVTVSVYRVKEK